MRTVVIYVLIGMMFLAGCGGRVANPIPVYLPGDDNRSCEGLKVQMAQLDSDMRRILPKTDKGGSNLLCGVAGVFLIVPWFFMDFKGADKIEYDAMRNRFNHLLVIAAEKNCDTGGSQRIPSVEEFKNMSKEEKAEFQKRMEASNTAEESK
jgi:hypothetical protein